jgi:tetratricopeptide (TPR) repeat protein
MTIEFLRANFVEFGYSLRKMKNYLLPTALFGTIALVSYVSPAAALSSVEVQRIAKQTTVQITGCDFGSGVIIRKNGNTYTVLTVAHALSESGCEIVAPDDSKYQVTQVKTFPNKVDLAVFTFTSNKTYPVAKIIDNSDRVEVMETIYVSGFPLSTAINTSIFTIVKGDVVANPPTKQQGQGYSLIYSNNTLPGHSGGPVWNDRGEVIAIHGQGDIEAKSQTTINDGVRVKTGYNLGITVNTFTKLAKIAEVNGYAPVLVAAKPKPVDDLIASAVLKESTGDYRGMLSDMERAISIDAQNSRLYRPRGVAKSGLGDNKGAIEDYNRAIEIDPNDAKSYINRGVAKYKLGDNKGAIEDYNRAIAINPDDAEAHNNRGAAKGMLGDRQGAIDDYNRAVAIEPSFAEAHNNRGAVKGMLGDPKGAIEDSDRAIVINPNFAEAYNNRGAAKGRLWDLKGAIDDYNRAIVIKPNFAEAYINRGAAKGRLGDDRGSIDDYNRAIAINPNFAQGHEFINAAKSKLAAKQGAIADEEKAAKLDRQPGITAIENSVPLDVELPDIGF